MRSVVDGKDSSPGSYEVEELKIEGKYGNIDLNHIFERITFQESIDSPFITGNITFTDAFNVCSNLPIVEGDKIKGKLKLPSKKELDQFISQYDDGELEFEFEIYGINNSLKVKQDIQVVSLAFCSSIWSDNMKGLVSQGFCQTPYISAAKQIYDEFLQKGGLQKNIKKKQLEIEQSDGMFNFIIPNWKPLDAIAWLLARSKKGKAVNYKFFEDKDKFRLVTVEKLMSEGPKKTLYLITPNTETYNSHKAEGAVISPFDQGAMERRYNQCWQPTLTNLLNINDASGYCMFGRRMITHDITFKRVKDYYFKGPEAGNYKLDEPRNYMDDFGDYTHMGAEEPLLLEDIAKSLGPKEGDDKLVMYPLHHHQWTGVEDNFKPEDWLRQYRAVRQHLYFYRTSLQTYGKFSLKAGDVITIDWASPQWTNKDKKEEDKRNNGDWLIVAIKRVFDNNVDGHHMVLELARNARTNKSDPIWEQGQEPNYQGDKTTY